MPQQYETCVLKRIETKKAKIKTSMFGGTSIKEAGECIIVVEKIVGEQVVELARSAKLSFSDFHGPLDREMAISQVNTLVANLHKDGWEVVGELKVIEILYLKRTATFRRKIYEEISYNISTPINALRLLKEKGFMTTEEYDKVLRRIYDSQ